METNATGNAESVGAVGKGTNSEKENAKVRW